MSETNPFLKEIEPLYLGLVQVKMRVSTVEESFLTFEGLLRAMDASSPPTFKQDGKHFEFLCAKGFIPLMVREEFGRQVMSIGIVTHRRSGELREHSEVIINLDDSLKVSLDSEKGDGSFRFIFLTPEQASDILSQNLVFDSQSRLHYLNGIDEDTTAVESFGAMLKFALSDRATDIHIEPGPSPRIRYRIDGIMQTGDYDLASDMVRRLTALIKQRAKLKIDEHMIPQDGGITFNEDDIAKNQLLRNCSLRVSIMPTIHDPREYGEKVVLRVLHSKTEEYNLQKLGMAPDIQAVVANRIKEPKGLILVTGPTGSGKTTTLYAMLMAINDGTKNIVTVEDPVEVPLSGITQISVNQQVDLTFARALRSVLRQDPDVILIGEIRDRETVDIALSATNTGHLAFATLHADDSPATLLRLQRLGVGGESIAPNLKAIMSQRLIRRACHDCLGKYDAKEELFYLLGGDFLKSEVALHQARPGNMGCRHCGGKGYFGRSLLLEYWGIAHKERQMILDGVEDRNAYIKVAMEHGFKPMIYLAIDALMNGKTDIAEIKRSAVTEEEFLRHGKHIGVMINHSIENLSEARPKEG